MLSLNVLFLGLSSLVVIDAAPVKLDKATSKLIETNYNQGLRSGANNRLAFPSYDGINKIPIKIEYDFPTQINATAPAPVAVAAPAPVAYAAPAPVAYAAPAPVAYAAPVPVQIAAALVHVVPHAFETKGETRVVVGHTSRIMKPYLGAGVFDDSMGLAQTKNAVPLFYIKQLKLKAPVPYNIDVEWQANGRQSSLDSQFTGDHLPTPPPMPEHRLIKKIGNILRSHIIPDGSLVFLKVAKSPVGPNVRRSVIQNIAADSDSNESLESEESTEVEESDSQEQVGTGAISRGSYSFTTPDGVVLTVNWVADENGFQATGDHLPTPPPMPEHVVKMLTDLKAAHLL